MATRDKEVESTDLEEPSTDNITGLVKHQQSQQQLNSAMNKMSMKTSAAHQKLVQKKISENDLKIIRAFTSNTQHIDHPVNSRAQMMRRRVILGNIYSQFNTSSKREGVNKPLSVIAQNSPVPTPQTHESVNPNGSMNNLKSGSSTKISDIRIAGSSLNVSNEPPRRPGRPPYKPRNSFAVSNGATSSRSSIANRKLIKIDP